MTMVMRTSRTIPAGEFKAKCLAILDEVGQSGGEVIVTKRGKPVAKVVPLEQPGELEEPEDNIDRTTPWPKDWPFPDLRHMVTYIGDVISPIDVEWEANQ